MIYGSGDLKRGMIHENILVESGSVRLLEISIDIREMILLGNSPKKGTRLINPFIFFPELHAMSIHMSEKLKVQAEIIRKTRERSIHL